MRVREHLRYGALSIAAVYGRAGGAIPVQLQRRSSRETENAVAVSDAGGANLHCGAETCGRRRRYIQLALHSTEICGRRRHFRER